MTPKKRISFENRIPLVSLMALGIAMPAMAQEAPASETVSGPQETEVVPQGGREVVVVTANKREESVQDIAVAVTAVTAQAKQELGIISITDLTNVTPGLSYTPGNERVTLRGIGRLSNSFGADPGVANYNDGIYTPFATLAGKDPLFIERVEVLRGPQGTLYGRNAIGGAINTISKRPTEDFTAEAVIGAGNFDYRKLGVAVSGPITDSVRYRLVGFKEAREGVDFNYATGDDVGWEIDDHFLELQLEGEIGDRFSWWFKTTDAGYNKEGPPGGVTSAFNNAPYLVNDPTQWFSDGGLTPNSAWGFTADPAIVNVTQLGGRQDVPFATNGERAYNSNIVNEAKLPKYDEYILELIYEFDNFDVKYTGGYTYYDYQSPRPGDNTPITSLTYLAVPQSAGTAVPACAPTVNLPVSVLPASAAACAALATEKTIYPDVYGFYGESRSLFSNEINLISTNDSPLQWLLGAYQYQDNQRQPGQTQQLLDEPIADFYLDTALGLGVVANPDRYLQYFSNTSLQHAYGLYGQLDYSINDQWKITGGLRWSKDVKESKEEGFLACYIVCRALGVPADYWNYTPVAYGAVVAADPENSYFDDRGYAIRRLKGDWDATTGTLGVEYSPTTDTLTFAKYSRGYKSGGFNNLGFGASPYTESEFVDAFEAGWKQEWYTANLTTNMAAFFYNYQDAQSPLSVQTGTSPGGNPIFSTQFVNLPEVETMGFELESNWNPVDALNIGFTYAWLSTEITDGGGTYADPDRDPRRDAVTGELLDPLREVQLEGNSLAQAPEHKVSATASYRFDFEDGSYLLPTLSYSWRSDFYSDFFNNSFSEVPAYDNLDARLNWYSSEGRFQVTAWVRNLLDEDQLTDLGANWRTTDDMLYNTYNYSLPRTWGVDLIFRY